MSLVEFAEKELDIILKNCTDDEGRKMQKAINRDILDIIKLFSEQGHSGFSAQYSMTMLKRLMDYKPLTPIEDNEEDWTKLDYDDDLAYQCSRCPSLFKDKQGRVYNVEGKVFSDDNGHTWYTCGDSRIYVELPYDVPSKPEYVVIDNKQERNAIMIHILNTIDKLNNTTLVEEPVQITVDEDSLIFEMISKEKLPDLQVALENHYNITKPLFNLVDCDEPKMWNVINFVMKSEREEPIKEVE